MSKHAMYMRRGAVRAPVPVQASEAFDTFNLGLADAVGMYLPIVGCASFVETTPGHVLNGIEFVLDRVLAGPAQAWAEVWSVAAGAPGERLAMSFPRPGSEMPHPFGPFKFTVPSVQLPASGEVFLVLRVTPSDIINNCAFAWSSYGSDIFTTEDGTGWSLFRQTFRAIYTLYGP